MNPNTARGAAQSIVFVNRFFYPDQSATSQMLSDLVRGLTASGYRVQVICSRQLYGDPRARIPPEEEFHGAKVHRVVTSQFGRHRLIGRAIDYATFYLSCALKLLQILHRGDVLIVKTDPPLLSLIAGPIAALKRVALVNWLQDVFPEVASQLGANPLPPWLDHCLLKARDASLRAARMNVAIGGRMRAYLASRGIAQERLCVIENWADGDAIRSRETSASSLRHRLKLDGRFVVCYSGNLGRAHEITTLLEAAKMLRANSDIVFVFIGDGAKMDTLKQAAADHGLASFRFLPYQPREALDDSLAAADVHLVSLLPALEGLIVPSKFYGILAAGRPVIFVGDADGDIGRVIAATGCGRVVSVGDSNGLREILCDLAQRSDELARMGVRAGRLFAEEYGFRRALQRWIAVIEAV